MTSTCLDFAHLFGRDELKDVMVRSLLSDCCYYGARLHGFVVMSHHIHLIVTPSETEEISDLIQKIKRNSAKAINPLLNDQERAQLKDQIGLNQRTFWMRSFRGLLVDSERVFHQKLDYIHTNPVRASLVGRPEEYRWSSARMYLDEVLDDHFVLSTEKALRLF
ncbi:MAG: transposase [Armatimonadota bacterium]